VDSHESELLSHESILEPGVLVPLPAYWLLNARLAWKISEAPFEVTIGLEGFNLLDFRVREYAGTSPVGRPDYGGERIGRRVVLFLQGEM
jgi:outer membrane receptor protein involved in Fe transport